jgi:hypothetical protein
VSQRTSSLEMDASIDPRIALLNDSRDARSSIANASAALTARAARRREAQWPTWQMDRSWPDGLLPLVRTHLEQDPRVKRARPRQAVAWGALFVSLLAIAMAFFAVGTTFGVF